MTLTNLMLFPEVEAVVHMPFGIVACHQESCDPQYFGAFLKAREVVLICSR